MASARYGYTHVTPSDRSSGLKRAHPDASLYTPSVPTISSGTAPPPSTDDGSPQIYTSAPIHDRSSTFTAYFSATLPPYDLQSHASFASASHKILAYRLPASAALSSTKRTRQSTLPGAKGPASAMQSGCSDDGEANGGRTVLRAMEDAKLMGSVVVARWYGGVMLGPVRFKHMQDVVGDVARVYREGQRERARERVEKAEEEREREELIAELGERDASIASLRGLLEGKKRALARSDRKGGEDEDARGIGTELKSPVRKIEYHEMALEKLRVLDQARDRTVAFLLKQIDEVEGKIKAVDAQASEGTAQDTGAVLGAPGAAAGDAIQDGARQTTESAISDAAKDDTEQAGPLATTITDTNGACADTSAEKAVPPDTRGTAAPSENIHAARGPTRSDKVD